MNVEVVDGYLVYSNPVFTTSNTFSWAGNVLPEPWHNSHSKNAYGVSYAIRNGGPTNLATGQRSSVRVFSQGTPYPDPAWVYSETEVNQIFPGAVVQPEASNLFDVGTLETESLPTSTLLFGTEHGGLPSHTMNWNRTRIKSVRYKIRQDVLSDLLTAYPSGVIVVLISPVSSQNITWDIHTRVVSALIHTETDSTLQYTFPLTDLVHETIPDPEPIAFPSQQCFLAPVDVFPSKSCSPSSFVLPYKNG